VNGQHLLIIGDSDDRARAIESAAVARGARVTAIEGCDADATRTMSGKAQFDHVAVVIPDHVRGRHWELDQATARADFERGFWLANAVCLHAANHVAQEGSIVIVAPSSCPRPKQGASVIGALNGALEGLARNVSVELGSRRCNLLIPGVYAEPTIAPGDSKSGKAKIGRHPELASDAIDHPANIAKVAVWLMADCKLTGSLVDAGPLMLGCCAPRVTGFASLDPGRVAEYS